MCLGSFLLGVAEVAAVAELGSEAGLAGGGGFEFATGARLGCRDRLDELFKLLLSGSGTSIIAGVCVRSTGSRSGVCEAANASL